jgi:glucokinase
MTTKHGDSRGDSRLVADIGGTNARFAWAAEGRPGDAVALVVADHDAFEAALDAALARLPEALGAFDLAIAAAGPVQDGRVQLTNAPWCIDTAVLARRPDVRRATVVNDFEAIAMALPLLAAGDVAPLDAVARAAAAALPMIVLGPGTGLGVALSVPDRRGGWIPVATEAGHAELGGSLPARHGIASPIRRLVGGFVAAEDILCGDGLVRLHEALAGPGIAAPAEVVAAARQGVDSARTAVRIFVEILGAFAGDAVLHTGAFGGVYLYGGVKRAIAEAGLFDAAAFRTAFVDKKDHRDLMAGVPVARITNPEPALLGLAGGAAT